MAISWFAVTLVLPGAHADHPLRQLSDQPRFHRPVAVAGNAAVLLTANRDSGSITLFDVVRGTRLGEFSIGSQPTDVIALGGRPNRFAVVCNGRSSVVLLEVRQGVPFQLAELETPRDPLRAATDRRGRLAVTSRWSRCVTFFQQQEGRWQLWKTVELPFAPRAAVFAPDGQDVVVADGFGGKLAVVPWSRGGQVRWRSIEGHAIGDLAVARAREWLLLTHQLLQPEMPTQRNRIFWGSVINNFVRGIEWSELGIGEPSAQRTDNRGDLASHSTHPIRQWYLLALGETGAGTGDPTGIAVPARGPAVVCLGGVDQIVLVDPSGFSAIRRIDVGRYPADVHCSPDGRFAYVVNQFDDSVTVVDLVRTDRAPVTWSLGPSPPPGPVERGESLFHDARLSHDGWYSCRSCHIDGHTNHLRNDNLGDGDYGAPKRVLSLLGVADTPPWSWLGSRSRLHDLVKRSLETTMQGEQPAHETDRDDLVAYLQTLKPPPGLAVARGTIKTELAARGAQVFRRLNCNECHPPPRYTTRQVWDVAMPDELGRREFNPPSLRGVSQRDSFFHDGRATTLGQALSCHGEIDWSGVSDEERRALLHFLETL